MSKTEIVCLKVLVNNEQCVCAVCSVTKLRLTLCDLMDCSPPGFYVHGIFQKGVLEWVATPFSKGSSRPRD